jgi:hypothetical protein
LSELRHDRTRNFTGGDFFRPQLQFGILNVRQELGRIFPPALSKSFPATLSYH